MKYQPGDVFLNADGIYTRVLCWDNGGYVVLTETGIDDRSEYVVTRVEEFDLSSEDYIRNLGDVFYGVNNERNQK